MNKNVLKQITASASTFQKIKGEDILSNYRYFLGIQTRWNDNDQYGHINNSVYYKYADTVINNYLIWFCGLNKDKSPPTPIGYMVDTQCQYRKPLNYPQTLIAGLGVNKIGKSSVSYKVAFFEPKYNYNTVKNENCKTETDPFLKLQIGSQGKWATDVNDIAKLNEYFYKDACVISRSVHVFVDCVTQAPVSALPEDLKFGLQRILFTSHISNL